MPLQQSVFRTFRLLAVALTVAGGTSASAVSPAQAQGIFERLFGGFARRHAPPPEMRGYAPERDPMSDEDDVRPRRLGGSVTYCVRTCDGRYFPVSSAGSDPKETCNAFCPAAETQVYRGGAIDHAYSASGKPYTALPNAFVYRDKIVDNCTCNGKSPLGLARADATDDPTLRTGDIVATTEGLMVARTGRKGAVEFTEIDKSKIQGEMRRRLSQVKVAPERRVGEGATTDGRAVPED